MRALRAILVWLARVIAWILLHLLGAFVRFPVPMLIVTAVLAVAVLIDKRVLTRRALGWRRVRSIRFRLWLHLRPGPGFASLPELWLRWGRLAALFSGGRARPGLSFWARLGRPATDFAVRLGRAQYFRRLYAALELQVLILAPPRTDKTGQLADRVISHPGPALTTSTRHDVDRLTSALREARGMGRSWRFNPEGVGQVPGDVVWDLLAVCTSELMAYRMADWVAGSTPGYGDLAWFEEQGSVGLAALLLAAARTGATLADVYRWASRRGHEHALQALAEYGNEELYAITRSLMEENRTAASVRATIARALKWAAIPQLAASVARGGGFDVDKFLLTGSTLHMIASGDAGSIITPVFRALASYVHYRAGLLGSRSPAGRLDPPLLMAMDEVAQICPVDLPSMLADSAGKGVAFMTVAHGIAKLEERYGKEGAAAIWNLSGVKVLLRGITEAQVLEDVDRAAGALGDDEAERARVVPPEVLRRLPKHCALVINMDLSPVVVRVRAAWERRDFRKLARTPQGAPARAVLAELGQPAQDHLLTDADLARLLEGERSPAPVPPPSFPMASGPGPGMFKPGRPS
jgi:type IV secretion system protein VirD4